MPKPLINVAAGLIMRADGPLLLAQRPDDKPWPGWWELPGGKIEPGETVLQALARELKEELGIDVTAATRWVTYTHEYPKNIVRLAFCRVTGWDGIPAGIEGQTLAWVDPYKPIDVGPLLPATEPPLRWLQLPDRYLLTSIGSAENLGRFIDKLTQALEGGLRLVQFREPEWAAAAPQEVYEGFTRVVQCCHEYGARCLVNSVHPKSWWPQADGVHFRAADVSDGISSMAQERPALVAVSAHSPEELALARAAHADFAVLGHVLDTPSHPQQPGRGWEWFATLAYDAGLPVFAIGGQSTATLEQARRHGAHGIAGIRHLM